MLITGYGVCVPAPPGVFLPGVSFYRVLYGEAFLRTGLEMPIGQTRDFSGRPPETGDRDMDASVGPSHAGIDRMRRDDRTVACGKHLWCVWTLLRAIPRPTVSAKFGDGTYDGEVLKRAHL